MFDNLKVPTIALVENMSYFICGSCDTKHRIFGPGFNDSIQESYGIKHSFEVPIVADIANLSDSGTPFVVALPDSIDYVQTYTDLAETVQQETELLKNQGETSVNYDPKTGLIDCQFADGTEK